MAKLAKSVRVRARNAKKTIVFSSESHWSTVWARIQRENRRIAQTIVLSFSDNEPRVAASIFLVCIVALLLQCFQNRNWAGFFQSIFLSYAAGGFFWVLCAWIPDFNKRRTAREWLKERYILTKRKLIRRTLESAGIWLEAQEVEELMTPKAFHEFLEKRGNSEFDVFGAAQTSWNCNPKEMQDIEFHLLQLVSGIESTLMTIGPRNREAYERLAFFCYRTREVFSLAVYSGDLAKYVGDDLVYPRLAAWHHNPSPAEQDAFSRGRDLLEEDIENL